MLSAKPAGFVLSSYLFVDFFFILSGFVMTHVYRERIAQGLSFKDYLLLRVGRLYPLHVFAHVLYATSIFGKWWLYEAGVGATNPAQALPLGSFWTNLLLLQGFGVHGYLYWNRPSWSIGAELGAYVIFFVFTVTLDRRGRLLAPFLLVLLLYGALLVYDDRRMDITYDFGLLRCIAGFYLGSCLLRASRKWGARLSLGRKAQTGAELACLAAVVVCVSNAASSQLFLAGAILAFAASIYVFSTGNSGPLGALLKTPWLGKLGVWSYSIYLLHLVCLEVAGDLAEHVFGLKLHVGIGPIAILLNALVIAFVIAFSRYTYEWIEKPFRERVKARLAAGPRRARRPDSEAATRDPVGTI
jgi:peptidoglycan/LPS O-acetylase OafA/YrhL